MKWLSDLVAAARTVRAALVMVVLTLGALIEHVAEPVELVANSVLSSKSSVAGQLYLLHPSQSVKKGGE